MENYKVLVVEDDESARTVLAKAVRKEGFEVVTAENGRIGLEIFKKENPHIIITDLKMPEVSGMEVLQRVKSLSPNVEVILVTAFGETETAVMALHEGVLDYIKKPIDLDQLNVALGRAKEKIDEYKKTESFPSLLLAEDDEMTRVRLGRFLEKNGWNVYKAADGEEAVKIFQEEKIDIALLDIKMPKMNGLDALHKMRDIAFDFEAIIITGYGDESSAIQAMRDGAMNFLKKPIDLDQMVVILEKAREKLNLQRSLRFRTRELELSQEIICKISLKKELIIEIGDDTKQLTRDFAQDLLDAVPVGLALLDKDMRILYANSHLTTVLEYYPEKVDEEFVNNLNKIGFEELSYTSLISDCNKVLGLSGGAIETVSATKFAYLMLMKTKVLRKKKKEKHILMVIRGERGQ